MIYLLLSILSSTGIFVIFKLFSKFKVYTLQAIVINYITASICGLLYTQSSISIMEIANSNWIIGAACLGVLFISIFNLMALTAQKNGLSVASVASKMSMIIPIIFGIVVFDESVGFQKVIGIILAFLAVYLVSVKHKETNQKGTLLLPLLLFLGSGIIDTSINFFAPDDDIPLFSAVIFGCAFCIGCLVLLRNYCANNTLLMPKAIPFGMLLGVVNYGSIYFLLKALRMEDLESSDIFTLNNVIIVALSSLVGLVVFKEVISKQNWLGIGVAIISIILVTLA